MKTTNDTILRKYWMRGFGLATLVLLCLGTAAAQTSYTVTDLNTLGGTFSLGTGVNLRGQVSGKANLLGDIDTHPFFWQNGVMTDLGTFGGPNGEASYLNISSRLVGGADTTNPDASGADFCGDGTGMICHGFIWMNGVMTGVGTLGGNNSFASGINTRIQVVGRAELSSIDPTTGLLEAHAFLWQNGAMTDLGTLGGANSFAVNINVRGQAIGFAEATFNVDSQLGFIPFRPALWEEGVVSDLGTLGGKLGQAVIINSKGQVGGGSTLPGDAHFHAFLWENGVMQDLGTLPGDTDSAALGLNDEGQAVGYSCDINGNCRAFLWQHGTMTDLNTLIPTGSGWQLAIALDINRYGQITGGGNAPNGEFHGFLLTPTNGDSTTEVSARQAGVVGGSGVVLPENVRKLLRFGKPGLGRLTGMAGTK
jgi:probable HAF family extracellular repeat protein